MPAFILVLFCIGSSFAAETFVNAQLHRDFNREVFTSTTEIWSGDRLGSSFMFADFDFARSGQTQSYFEVSRHFALIRTKKAEYNLTIQYNDGVTAADATGMKLIPRTVLGGLAVTELRSGDAQIELQALLRQEFASAIGWQLTAVWFWPLRKSRFEFLGSVDWNSNEYLDQPVSVQAEPQIQYRYRQAEFGTEWEISRNFAGAYTEDDGFEYHKWYVHPTLFVRYDL